MYEPKFFNYIERNFAATNHGPKLIPSGQRWRRRRIYAQITKGEKEDVSFGTPKEKDKQDKKH